MNSDLNQLQLSSFSTPAEMPSGTRVTLPKPKKAGRERGNSLQHYVKADISIEDQLKYRRHLLRANQNFVGFNKQNLDIIAISFEHLCFSEAENKKEYKAKIRAKLREWNYDEFSEDGEVDDDAQAVGHSLELTQTTAITGENPSFVSNAPNPSSFILRTPTDAPNTRNPTPTPHSSGSTASKGSSSKLGRSSSSRPRLPSPPQQSFQHGSSSSASALFDPVILDRIDLNDPATRASWVEAVWHYFNSGGRLPLQPQPVNTGRDRSSSFTSMPSPASPTTPTMGHFQPLTVPNQQSGGHEYEAMEGLETYYQEQQHQQDDIRNLGHMVDAGTLSPNSLSFVQEQWQKIQDHSIDNH